MSVPLSGTLNWASCSPERLNVSSPMVTLNLESALMTWSNFSWTTPSSARSPKLSVMVANMLLTMSPALRSSLTRAPLVTTNCPPSSTVIDEPVATVMFALTVNEPPSATTTWPLRWPSSVHVSVPVMEVVPPSVGAWAAARGRPNNKRVRRRAAVGAWVRMGVCWLRGE